MFKFLEDNQLKNYVYNFYNLPEDGQLGKDDFSGDENLISSFVEV